MCGRYALALRPSQVRQMLEDDDMPVEDIPEDEGQGAPRQSYNFAPGYHGIVYRADTSDRGAGPRDADRCRDHAQPLTQQGDEVKRVKYKLQSMKWGLVPSWTKRNPDYSTTMKAINCRDDSLKTAGGMWASMKARKRCIVIAQGFFEWLKVGVKKKVPHYVKRRDGHLMCFAGLWDCVQYEGSDEKNYTYTIITTDSNKQLRFLHERMPVILNAGSDSLKTWLDPSRSEWSNELQSLLKPFDGDLDIFPVSKDVGKVGNNSPSFIIPIDSKENKSNIANFFANASKKQNTKYATTQKITPEHKQDVKDVSHEEQFGVHAPNLKRKASAIFDQDEASAKKFTITSPAKEGSPKISATKNTTRSQKSSQTKGSQKITKFFNSPNGA